MADRLMLGFEPKTVDIPVSRILPLKKLPQSVKGTVRYQRIVASVKAVGIIEPPVVYPESGQPGTYVLLDGHVRLEVAKDLQIEQLQCLISTDDESFTYNHKVNQLSPIQEHFMIRKAIEGGASEDRLAKALNLDAHSIRLKRDLLEGICPEAVELLKNRRVSAGALRHFKKVRPSRQIEMAEIMISSNNMTAAYAKCLIAGTARDQMAKPDEPKEIKGIGHADMARMERELSTLERDFKAVEADYGDNMLNLVVIVGYLRRLLDNAAVVRYLSRHHSEILGEFQKLLEATNLRESA